MKKRKFLIGILAAVSAFSMALITGCSADDMKQKIDQLKCKHEFGEVVVIEESTCSEKGKGEKTCTKCEKVEEVKLDLADHVVIVVDGVSATCTKTGLTDGTKCSVCEEVIVAQQEIPALGHIVVKDKSVEATCLQGGLTEGEHCSRCDEILTEQAKIPATGHNLVILEAVEPTCSTEGKTQGVWCNKCETIFTEQDKIPVLEHVDEDENNLCDFCGFSMTPVLVEGNDVGVGRYRIYTQGERLYFDLVFKYNDESVLKHTSFSPDIPPLGDNEPYTLDLTEYGITGDVFAIYVYDSYVDIVFKDGDGTYTDTQGKVYLIDTSSTIKISSVIPVSIEIYKVY